MVQYSGYVATPANNAHGASWKPRLEVRLLEAAHHGGTLVNTDPQVFDLPSSGAYSVDLIPSDQMRSRSGRAALYQVTETWLDQGGHVQRYTDWGTFYLTSEGGNLSEHGTQPPAPNEVWVSLDPPPEGSKYQWWLHATGDPNLPPGTDPGTGNLYRVV